MVYRLYLTSIVTLDVSTRKLDGGSIIPSNATIVLFRFSFVGGAKLLAEWQD